MGGIHIDGWVGVKKELLQNSLPFKKEVKFILGRIFPDKIAHSAHKVLMQTYMNNTHQGMRFNYRVMKTLDKTSEYCYGSAKLI